MTNKERFKEIFVSQVMRPGAADLLAWLGTTDFFEAPAGTRFHGAYPGGLVEHSLNVYYALLGQYTIREYGGESVAVVALRPVRYTADFRLVYADGTVEIVEIKSKFVRRMQRDYALRRRVFLEQVARPAGWKFTEIITADSKEEIDRWTELTKGAK